MKILKRLLVLTLLFIPFIGIKNVYAASARVKLTTNNETVSVGSTFTVTVLVAEDGGKLGSFEYQISHDSSFLALESGEEYQADVGDGNSSTKAYTLKYKAIANGSTTIKVTSARILDFNTEKEVESSKGSLNITVGGTSSNNSKQDNRSSDNSLKSLTVEGMKLTPEFNKETLEYSVDLSNDVKEINIKAEKNDEKATVSGDGKVEVKEGQNIISITVTAENGASRTYKINANVVEASPITVKINNKEYTVLKKLTGIDTPNGFEKETIMIDNNEIESFYNKKIKCTLVALKDQIGNISLYVYNSKNNKYTKYSPIVSNSINIIVLDEDINIPHGYKKDKFDYNGEEVVGYSIKDNSKFRLVYGLNVETGKKGFYLYDMQEGTIQRFDNDQIKSYENLVSKLKLAFIVLGAVILFLLIVVLVLLSKNSKFKSKYLELKKIQTDTPSRKVKYQDLEGTTVMKSIELKEEKKKHKKEKTFLDE